jgi:Predicted transcriptional regulators
MDELYKDHLIAKMTDNLSTLRAKASFTQKKLAELIGVSRQTLVAVENKKRKMSWNTFLACLLIFKINKETNLLLETFALSNDELNAYLSGKFVK